MSRTAWIMGAIVVAAAVGWGIWLLTDSTTASYIVGVAGAAAGIAALLAVDRSSGNSRIASAVDVGKAKKSTITGVDDGGGTSSIKSEVKVENAKESKVTGVRKR